MLQEVVCINVDRYIRILKIGVPLLSLLTLGTFSFLFTGTVHAAEAISYRSQAAASCSGPSQLNNKSLLVVLLDRSGSLVAGNEPTDPDLYSTSVTKALTDLWPGNIAVIPFGNGQANVLGNRVFPHSDSNALTTLKGLIPQPDPNADTPLGLAMENAQKLFQQQGVTPCSKVVLITDGQPTGPQARVDDINNTFTPWFATQGIPVNAFALKLDLNTDDGHNADILLRHVTDATNGQYIPVVNTPDLASSVIGLYSSWKGLSFTPITENQQNGNYAVAMDSYVNQATIITFHSTDVSVGQLEGNGTAIPPNKDLITTDRHYQMDNLVTPIPPGTYTITVGSDPAASVYALVDSSLKAQFTETPTAAYTGQSLTIKAHFVNEQGGVVINGATKFTATVTEVINGQPVKVTIDLHQLAPDSDIFAGSYLVPASTITLTDQPQLIGNLTLDLTATEGDATRSAQTTVPLYVPQKPPPPPCNQGFVTCNRQTILTTSVIATPFLLLLLAALIAWLIWRQQPAPFGTLSTPPLPHKRRPGDYDEDNSDIPVALAKVGATRSLKKRIFQRSVLTSYEIESHRDARGGFDFDPASFQLVFKRGKKMDIHLTSGGPIILRSDNEKVELESGESHPLERGNSIFIGNKERATFS